MNVSIIGNGACALNSKVGSFIDSCDVVIRLGSFVIEHYQEYIGSKTDVYVSRWYKSKYRTKDFFQTLKQIWIPRSYSTREEKYDDLIKEYDLHAKIKYIPDNLIFSYKARYPFRYVKTNMSKKGNKELYCCIPDSGIVAIDMARHFYPGSNIFITGFDNCQSGYYWNPKKQLDTLGEDLMELQLRYLKDLVVCNVVKDMSNVL